MKRLGWLWASSFALALHVGLGCSGSESSAPPPTQPNLSPTAVAVLTAPADVQASHRLDVQVELSSATDVQAAGVAFVAFPKAEYDAHAATITSYVLGSSAYDVPAGGGTFAAELSIPPSVPAGDYYVVPVADPLNTIAESNEGDQYGATAPITINVDHRDDLQLMIEQAKLAAPAVELAWAEPGKPGPIGLTVRVRAEASAPVSGAEVTAVLRGPGPAPVTLPLSAWDPATSARQTTFAAPTLLPGQPYSMDLDLALAPDLSAQVDGMMKQVLDACVASIDGCVASHGVDQGCAQSCLWGPRPPDPADPITAQLLSACLMKCVPFTVEATLDKPGAALYEPPGAPFGRTLGADLQLIAPPSMYPFWIRALDGTRIEPVQIWPVWACNHETLQLVAEGPPCAEAATWKLVGLPGESYPKGMGSVGPLNLCPWWQFGCTPPPDSKVGSYTPPRQGIFTCDPWNTDIRVLVEVSACGRKASIPVTVISNGQGLPGIEPPSKDFEIGVTGETEFKTSVACTPDKVTWTLQSDPADAPRLPQGHGALVSTGDGRVAVRYSPPPSITAGPPVTVKLKADAPDCGPYNKEATITLALRKEIRYEQPFARTFSNDLFGIGIDLYAGAAMDGAGAWASAHAIVPAKVFGAGLDLLRVTDDASVDPGPGGASSFVHRIDAFGLTVDSWSCPGDPKCTATAEIWSDSKCIPEGPPPLCAGTSYLTPCDRNSDCAGLPGEALTCLDGRCTKKCDSPNDCTGIARFCAGSLEPGPYKKVFMVTVVPVTVEGKLCLDYGIDTTINLLTSAPDTVKVELNPYLQASGYASVAVGYTGLLAVGVKGEVIVLRDDFYGITGATISDVPCSLTKGCTEGTLDEYIENVIQGPLGELSLFADYPTLEWCGWTPCVGVARAEQLIASIGPAFQVENRCDACDVKTPCASGKTCVGGFCDDGFPGLLCATQSALVGE